MEIKPRRRQGPLAVFLWDPEKFLKEQNAALQKEIRALTHRSALFEAVLDAARAYLGRRTKPGRERLEEAVKAYDAYFGESAEEPKADDHP